MCVWPRGRAPSPPVPFLFSFFFFLFSFFFSFFFFIFSFFFFLFLFLFLFSFLCSIFTAGLLEFLHKGASLFFVSQMDAESRSGVFVARVAAGGRVVRYRGAAYVLEATWTRAQRKSARRWEMRRIDAVRAFEGVGEVLGKMGPG